MCAVMMKWQNLITGSLISTGYQCIMRTTWADTIRSEVTLLVTYPVAKDTGRWQAAKNFAPMPNVRVGLVVRTTEKSVTRGWEYY